MRRVVILGPPGSGKSTLARRIGARHGLPVFHLDQVFWQEGWVRVPDEEFARRVADLAEQPSWIMDGNYTAAIAPRLRAADTVIYLDVPRWLSLMRVMRRILTNLGKVRPDSAPGCPERLNRAFLAFVWTWHAQERAKTVRHAEEFARRRIILRGRDARSPRRALG